MSETCQKLAFTHPIVVLKSGLKNNWMKKLDRVNRPLGWQNLDRTFAYARFHRIKVGGGVPPSPTNNFDRVDEIQRFL